MKVEELLKHFDSLSINSENESKMHENEMYDDKINTNKIIQKHETKDLIWPFEVLPQTEFTKNQSLKNLSKIEQIRNETKLKPSKLIEIMHALDLQMIKKLNALDLVTYDGIKSTIAIRHLQNKNRGTLNWFNQMEFKDLNKMIQKAELLKNYNLINIIVGAMQGKNLSRKNMDKIIFYKNILDNQESGVIPLEWMFKDCADSNINVNSDIASMRFCKIVDKLHEMKLIESDFILTEKYKQYVLEKIWENIDNLAFQVLQDPVETSGVYLLL